MDIILIKTIFLKFLLMPLLALTLVLFVVFIKKKNALIKNKTLIVYVLLASLVLCIPGFMGFAGNTFSPYGYLFSQLYFLMIGIVHVNLLQKYFKNPENSNGFTILFECVITLLCMVLGAYLYYLLYNWVSPFKGYAAMSATCILIFALPLCFYYCYLRYIAIPLNIYSTWTFHTTISKEDLEGLDFNKLLVVNVELIKDIKEGRRFRIKAKAPSQITLGDWFYRVLEDYNLKDPKDPIIVKNEEGEFFSWIFYIKKSFFHPRRSLDFEKAMHENRISDKDVIICRRVVQHTLEPRPVRAFNNNNINE